MAEEPDDSTMSSSDSDMEDDNTEAETMAKVKQLEEVLLNDPLNYQALSDRVDAYKTLGELEKLREARESFAKAYPLTPQIWLSWTRDEQNLAASTEEKLKVFELFDRAVVDYLSVELWLEYCQFALCGLGTEEGVSKAREVFERGVTAVGGHVGKGALIWEAYREFENALMSMMTEKEEQRKRIDKLFKRQLTLPLLDMEDTFNEYQSWRKDQVEGSVKSSYESAAKLLQERQTFEERMLQTEGDAQLSVYQEYLEFEKKSKHPVRIQNLFERRITDHCLQPDVWLEYLRYLELELKIDYVILPVYERAVRNCTWSGEIWARYIRTLERFDKPQKEVVSVFERSLTAGFSDPADYLKNWLAFIDFKRRKMKFDDYEDDEEDAKEKEMEEMRELFTKAVNHLASVGGDAECKIARYWASMEADRFRAMEEARKIWSDVLVVIGERSQFCLEYLSLEKMFGDTKHLRKLFPRVFECCHDWPELVGEVWIQFEREEGSLAQFEEAERKVEVKMAKVREKREAEVNKEKQWRKERADKRKEKDKEKRREKRQEVAAQKREQKGIKRKAEQDSADQEHFKKPVAPPPDFKGGNVAPPPGFKGGNVTPPPGFKGGNVAPPPGFKSVAPPPGFKGGNVAPPPGFKGENVAPPPGFKGENVAPPPGFSGESPAKKAKTEEASTEEKTIFVSNLDFGVEESQIREFLSSSPVNVVEVRLIKTPAGKSKGFAYVELHSVDQVEILLKRDRDPIHGRPVFISKCKSEKNQGQGHEFKYKVGLEKNKVFVKGLPLSMTKEELESVFSQYGKLKEVRMVTYRIGHSKGIAFIEYEEESSASKAVVKADEMKIGNKVISVAISNPPARKGDKPVDNPTKSLGSKETSGGPRGRGRSQVALLPRSVKVSAASASKNGNQNGASKTETAPKSNDEFRNMMLAKK